MAALTALQRLMKNPKTAKFVESLKHSDLPANWADDPEIVDMAGAAYKEMGTDSPFWQATFKGTKAVDKNGDPLVLYHGTHSPDFDVFGTGTPNAKLNQESFFFSDKPVIADSYAAHRSDLWGNPEFGEGSRVYPVYLNMKKPMSVNAKGGYWNDIYYKNDYLTTDDLANLAAEKGKDGLVVKNVWDYGPGAIESTAQKGTDYVAFDPRQIKSIFNRGTFNPADPDMYKGLLPLIAAGGAAAALAPDSAQAAIPAERYTFPADRPGYVNPEPPLGTPLVDPVDILTAPVGVTTAAGKAAAMAAEPVIAYGVDRTIDGLLGLFQRDRERGGGGGGI